MDELTPEQRFAMEDESVWVPRALAKGEPREQIIQRLLQLDWKPEAAVAYVDRIAEELRQYEESPQSRAELVRRFKVATFGGAGLLLLSLFVSLSTLLSAVAFGGIYIIFYGLILTSLATLAYGITGWRRYGGSKLRL